MPSSCLGKTENIMLKFEFFFLLCTVKYSARFKIYMLWLLDCVRLWRVTKRM